MLESSHSRGRSSSSYGSLDCPDDTHPSSISSPQPSLTVDLESAMSATAALDSAVSTSNDNVTSSFGSDDFVNRNKEAAIPTPPTNTNCDGGRCDCQGDFRSETHPARNDHFVKSRQYYRDMMLGVNDGLVSTFLLVAGVVGGGMDVSSVLLTSLSGAIAGAISMFAGEYVATKSQNEVMKGEIKLEHEHITNYHQEEMRELGNLFSLIGIPGSSPHLCHFNNVAESTHHSSNATSTAREARMLRQRMTHYYASNPDALLKIMIALEFGVIDDEVRSPLVAGATSMAVFLVGSLSSVIPFVVVTDPISGLIISGIATAIGLWLVGAMKSLATRGNMCFAALENLLITAAGGGIAYGIGVGFQNLTSK